MRKSLLRAAQVIVFGDVFVDVQTEGLPRLPQWSEDVCVRRIQLLAGGSALNTARQLQSVAEHRHSVSLVSAVGSDSMAAIMDSTVREDRFPIDTLSVKRCEEGTATCIVLCGMGERTFISNLGALTQLDSAQLKSVEQRYHEEGPHTHVHFGGYFCTVGVHHSDFAEELEQLAESHPEWTLSLDTQTGDLDSLTQECFQTLQRVLPLLDVLFVNEDELRFVLQNALHLTRDPGLSARQSLALFGQWLAKSGRIRKQPLCVALKRGEHGCMLGVFAQQPSGEVSLHIVEPDSQSQMIVRHTSLVDSTGAGDAFDAGFLAEWLHITEQGTSEMSDEHWQRVMRTALKCGSLNCTRFGGCATPLTAREVYSLIEK